MNISRKFCSIILLSLLTFSILSTFEGQQFEASAQPKGSLTGNISDNGVDTDSDGTFDFLEIGVEVNVTTTGNFTVSVSGLWDSMYNYISISNETTTYLGLGIKVVNVSLNGPAIHGSGLDPMLVGMIELMDEYYYTLDYLFDTPLSREYYYPEFDLPSVSLTGTIYDLGVDTDSDGTFDYLKVGVEVNVSASGMFQVNVVGFYDPMYSYIAVHDENSTYLGLGIRVVYVSLEGTDFYTYGFNPSSLSNIYLYDEYHNSIGYLHNVSLSRVYSYTEFDPPPDFLTGTVFDKGVDTDGDGAFNYLEVCVEVNVTNTGQYEIVVWGLHDYYSNSIYIQGQKSEYLNAGLQVVNVSLYGPTIYTSGLNPVNVSVITLYSVEYVPPFSYMRYWLGSVGNIPLSREYSYTEFNSPFMDITVDFVVYPDGRVVMGGALDYTHMVPPNPVLSLYGNVALEKNGTTTDMLADFTFIAPPEEGAQFPFNSSDFTLFAEYSSDLLTTTIHGSTSLPPAIAHEFPFNITDFTVMGEYADGTIEGNLTVDVWNGFPLDDIIMDFQGNNTYIHLNSSTTVIFGDYPDFVEINATFLEEVLATLTDTMGGQGPDSLYNMTNGILEFTVLNNVTTLHNGNATVDFEAKVEGDLIQAFVNMTYQPAYMYDLLNTTWSSIENGTLQLTYAHAFGEADMDLVFTTNVTPIIDNVIPILPDLLPPEEVPFIESLLNTTYCTINSAQVSLDYHDGQAVLTAAANIQDFNAELDYVKKLLLIFNNPQPFPPHIQAINTTQIDITNFAMSLNLTESSVEANISGLGVRSPFDWINATSFKLERFLNITSIFSGYEPPTIRQKLLVTIEGGSNATHAVRIVRPGIVPAPDQSAPGGMVWFNQSISKLKDLIFQIGLPDEIPPELGIPIHTPEVPDNLEAVTVLVNVTDADTGVRYDGVFLSYRANGGNWNNVTMSKMAGGTEGTYEGEIPGLLNGTYVEYMIIAYDYANNNAIENKSGLYYVYTVIPEFPTLQTLVAVLALLGLIIVVLKRNLRVNGDSLSRLRHKVRTSLRF